MNARRTLVFFAAATAIALATGTLITKLSTDDDHNLSAVDHLLGTLPIPSDQIVSSASSKAELAATIASAISQPFPRPKLAKSSAV